MRRRRRALSIAVCLASLIAAGSLASTWAADAAAPSSCTDVVAYGLAGSGQGSFGSGDNAYGDEVKDVLVPLRNRFAGQTRRLTVENVAYPAASVFEAAGSVGLGYEASRRSGYDALFRTMKARAAMCPDTKFVLVGYSQGAHVVGDVLNSVSAGKGPVPASRMLASALIADPRFNPAARGVTRVNGARNGGVFGPRPNWSSALDVSSVCIANDAVCDNLARVVAPLQPAAWVPITAGQQLAGVHGKYRTTRWPGSRDTITRYLAKRLGDRVTGTPATYSRPTGGSTGGTAVTFTPAAFPSRTICGHASGTKSSFDIYGIVIEPVGLTAPVTLRFTQLPPGFVQYEYPVGGLGGFDAVDDAGQHRMKAGTYRFTVTATGADRRTSSKTYTVTIRQAGPDCFAIGS